MRISRLSTNWNRRTFVLTMAVSLALFAAGCQNATPTNTSAPPTSTATSEPTPTPTTPPTSTPTPVPTATPTATPEPARLGTEEVRTDVLEANFEPGASRSPTQVWIYGSGFRPGQEVYVLLTDASGAQTDISIPAEQQRDGGGTVWPLIANDQGAWATLWTIGRFSRPDVGAEGQFSLTITDTEFNILATTPLALCNNEARAEGEEVPDYCSA